MTFEQFHNALRILTNIDMHELIEAGVIEDGDDNAWGSFRSDPYRWFIRADDKRALRLWAIIEQRNKRNG